MHPRPPTLQQLAAILASLAFAPTAGGQDAAGSADSQGEPTAPSDDLFVADEVVVTGTRTERTLRDSPVATQVVGRKELDNSGAQNAAEALEDVSGVRIQSSVGGQEARIQGIGGRRVLILVDGQRVAGRIDGVVDLSRFPVENIERIEIVRGAASALYGSDALGGVINIITRRTGRPLEGRARAQWGFASGPRQGDFWGDRAENYDLSANAGTRQDKYEAQLSAGYRHAGAFDLDPSTVATTGSAFDELSLQATGRWLPTKDNKIAARVSYLSRDQQGVDSGLGGIKNYDRRTLSEQVNASVDPSFSIGDAGWVDARMSHSYWRHQFYREQQGEINDTGNTYEDNIEQLTEGSLQLNLPGPNTPQLVTLGVDALHQRLDSPRISKAGRRTRVSPFIQDEWTPLDSPYLVILPGVRVDVDSQYGFAVSPKLSVRYDPHPDVVLRLSGGRGFRAPSFKELLLDFENPGVGYRVTGNPNLTPETSYSASVDAEWRATKYLDLGLSLYRNELRDLIAVDLLDVVAGTQLFSYVNIASAYLQGAELTSTVRARGLTMTLGYVLADTRDRDQNRPLQGRANHTASARVGYEPPGGWPQVSLRASVIGRRLRYESVSAPDDDEDGEEAFVRRSLPGYASMDIRVAKTLFRFLELYAGADNLLNAGDVDTPLRPLSIYAGATGRY